MSHDNYQVPYVYHNESCRQGSSIVVVFKMWRFLFYSLLKSLIVLVKNVIIVVKYIELLLKTYWK